MQPETVPRAGVVSLVRDPRDAHTLICLYPYSASVNAVVKDIPGRVFDPSGKQWSIPNLPDNVLTLKRRLRNVGWQLALADDLKAELNGAYKAGKDAAAVRASGDSAIAFDFLTEPYAHQRAGLDFLAKLGSGALFWEMGLGKTKTAIDYAEWLERQLRVSTGRFEVLVICPNTVKRNWGDEIVKHAGHDDFVIPTGSLAKRVTQLGAARYTIVNCEALSLNPLAKAIAAYNWDLVIVDESTRFKTPKAARTKTLHKMAHTAKRRLILTGTPITGKPEDAWSQLEFVRPGLFGKSFWRFSDRYLHKDWAGNVDGIKDDAADELVQRIDSCSYRILKSEVLDLPPKVLAPSRMVAMDGDQLKAYRQMREELRIEIEGRDDITANNILTMLLRLTQVTAGLVGSTAAGYEWLGDRAAKVRELDALLLEEMRGQQAVVFGIYKRELEELAKRYAKPDVAGKALAGTWQAPIIYGPTPEHVRADLVRQFQAGDLQRLFIQTRTGGIGINLTPAPNAVYHTRSWSLEEWLQSQDRLARIGQTGTVTLIPIEAEGSIDQDIAKALIEKQQLADHLTGDGARKLAASILAR